ncbi:MAG: hypothetical protein CM1200mP1_12700 [Candidatus Neomarinimicrobiota bacterium]|nr:MAG: hypothetical protein CM1200mP1_12700 [Candidatus Neomarinimicrobiota bacterium]
MVHTFCGKVFSFSRLDLIINGINIKLRLFYYHILYDGDGCNWFFGFLKRHGDFEDFFLAGRSLTTPLFITTLISTYYGLGVLFGDSQLAFTDGVVAWFGYARPTYAFFLIAAFLLAHRLKKENFLSLPDILDRYYGKETRYIGATAFFIYSLPSFLYAFGMLGEVIWVGRQSLAWLLLVEWINIHSNGRILGFCIDRLCPFFGNVFDNCFGGSFCS